MPSLRSSPWILGAPQNGLARLMSRINWRISSGTFRSAARRAIPEYLVRDHDSVYGEIFARRIRAMVIRDRPIAPRSPWQNGHAERLIGSLRRECLDHVVVFGERHLRHVLFLYMDYYNTARTHLSLNKDAPVPRAIQAIGAIHANPILGGLHHQYARI
jgi:transposase InsO family protein